MYLLSNMHKSNLIIQNKKNSICIKYISKFVSAKNVHIPTSLYEGSIQKNVNGMKSSSWNKRKLNQHFFLWQLYFNVSFTLDEFNFMSPKQKNYFQIIRLFLNIKMEKIIKWQNGSIFYWTKFKVIFIATKVHSWCSKNEMIRLYKHEDRSFSNWKWHFDTTSHRESKKSCWQLEKVFFVKFASY